MVPQISMAEVISAYRDGSDRSCALSARQAYDYPKPSSSPPSHYSGKTRDDLFIRAILKKNFPRPTTDDIDQRLINALMADSRLSLKALAQVSGLSASSVAERLRKLEERGVSAATPWMSTPRCFGYQFQAIVRIRPLPGKLHEVERQIRTSPSSPRCDKVTGDDCFIARLQVRSMEQLDTLLDRINGYAETNTAIVKEVPG